MKFGLHSAEQCHHERANLLSFLSVHFRAVLRTFLKKRRKVDFEQWQLSRFNTDDIYYFCPIKPPRSVVAPLDDLEKFDNPIML
jgi:hypothetical protein